MKHNYTWKMLDIPKDFSASQDILQVSKDKRWFSIAGVSSGYSLEL